MIFVFFATFVAAAFFVGSLISLHYGRHLGLRYRNYKGADITAGLATVEGAIFGLMGLLLAFTIAGALQRFDDRRQLVIQEATAATTAYDRLSLFEGDIARKLQTLLKEYVRARVDLYRMAHDFLPLQREEDFSDRQESKLLQLKNNLWDAVVAACPQANYRPACALSHAEQSFRGCATACWRQRKTSAADYLLYAFWPRSRLFAAGWLRHGRECEPQLDTHGAFRRNSHGGALYRH
jgi:hypothetical protein